MSLASWPWLRFLSLRQFQAQAAFTEFNKADEGGRDPYLFGQFSLAQAPGLAPIPQFFRLE